MKKLGFSTLIEMNSILGYGFLMNKIISLLNSKPHKALKDELVVLEKAHDYIVLIKDGKKLMIKNLLIKNEDKALKAFRTALEGLNNHTKDLTLDIFKNIIENSEAEINYSIRSKNIEPQKLNNALTLFNSIRKYLIEEANSISTKEQEIF